MLLNRYFERGQDDWLVLNKCHLTPEQTSPILLLHDSIFQYNSLQSSGHSAWRKMGLWPHSLFFRACSSHSGLQGNAPVQSKQLNLLANLWCKSAPTPSKSYLQKPKSYSTTVEARNIYLEMDQYKTTGYTVCYIVNTILPEVFRFQSLQPVWLYQWHTPNNPIKVTKETG